MVFSLAGRDYTRIPCRDYTRTPRWTGGRAEATSESKTHLMLWGPPAGATIRCLEATPLDYLPSIIFHEIRTEIFMKFEILVTRDVLTATCPGPNLFPLTVVSAEALQGESFIGFVVRKSVFRENDCQEIPP